jgi:hypothetical protein
LRLVVETGKPAGPMSVLGYARKLHVAPRRTQSWMRELREGDVHS